MTIHEVRTSRRTGHRPYSRTDTHEQNYYISNLTNETNALSELRAEAPSCLNVLGKNMWAREYYVDPIDGNDKWLGRVLYRQAQYVPIRQFEIASSNIKLKQSYKTAKYPPEACDYQSAINVDGDDHKVEGTDVWIGSMNYVEIHRIPEKDMDSGQEYLTTPKLREYLTLIGMTNSQEFRGWCPEEVLFLGMEATPIPDDIYYYSVTFKWAISPTTWMQLPFKDVNEDLIRWKKPGWWYMWYDYDPGIGGGDNCEALLQLPKAAYMEKIYRVDCEEDLCFNSIFPPPSCEWGSTELPTPPVNENGAPLCPQEDFPECSTLNTLSNQASICSEKDLYPDFIPCSPDPCSGAAQAAGTAGTLGFSPPDPNVIRDHSVKDEVERMLRERGNNGNS